MTKENNTHPEQFKIFNQLLMENAPEGYVPWYFPLNKNDKNPDGVFIASRAPKTHDGSAWSWKASWARLTYEEAYERLSEGFNVGISARVDDQLVLMDADSTKRVNELPETLTISTGKRFLAHAFCFTEDKRCKTNIPTGTEGELRASDQYLVACGSYVPVTKKGLVDKVKEGSFTQSEMEVALNDKMLGVYTIKKAIPPKKITWEDIPQFYKDKQIIRNEKKEVKEFHGNVESVHTIYKITFTQIFGNDTFSQRGSHPLHGSDTGTNFSVLEDYLAQCSRDMVTLTPVQYLAVKSGWCSCHEAGKIWKSDVSTSLVNGNPEALKAVTEQAIKDGLIPADTLPPEVYKHSLEYFISGKKGDSFSAPMFADDLMANNKFLTMKDNKELYVYDNLKGHYINNGEILIHKTLKKVLGGRFYSGFVGEVKSNIMGKTYVDRNFLTAVKDDFLNVENGVINMITGEFVSHSPDFLFLTKLPIKYNANATCPEIINFLIDITFPDHEMFIKLLEEASYMLFDNCRFEKGFIHVGAGSNGKNKYTDILMALLGNENICTLSLSQIGQDKFMASKLYGKMANIGSEMNKETAVKYDDVIKSLVTGDRITVDKKFVEPFDIANTAKITTNANKLPRVNVDYAWSRRWQIIEFWNKFVDDSEWQTLIKQKENEPIKIFGKDAIIQKLYNISFIKKKDKEVGLRITSESELSGFLNLLILIRYKMIKNKGFTFSDTPEVTGKKYANKSGESVPLFISDLLEKKDGEYITLTDLYSSYVDYCYKMNLTPCAENWFGINMSKYNSLGFVTKRVKVTEVLPSGKETRENENRYYNLGFKNVSGVSSVSGTGPINYILEIYILFISISLNNRKILETLETEGISNNSVVNTDLSLAFSQRTTNSVDDSVVSDISVSGIVTGILNARDKNILDKDFFNNAMDIMKKCDYDITGIYLWLIKYLKDIGEKYKDEITPEILEKYKNVDKPTISNQTGLFKNNDDVQSKGDDYE
jgi:P4 family phage/plasmid primase-like protien